MYIIEVTFRKEKFMLKHMKGLGNCSHNGCDASYEITRFKKLAYKFKHRSDAEEYREKLPDDFEPAKIVRLGGRRRR